MSYTKIVDFILSCVIEMAYKLQNKLTLLCLQKLQNKLFIQTRPYNWFNNTTIKVIKVEQVPLMQTKCRYI